MRDEILGVGYEYPPICTSTNWLTMRGTITSLDFEGDECYDDFVFNYNPKEEIVKILAISDIFLDDEAYIKEVLLDNLQTNGVK